MRAARCPARKTVAKPALELALKNALKILTW
jgi:hypothetical protein